MEFEFSDLIVGAVIYGLLRGEMWLRSWRAKRAEAAYRESTYDEFHPYQNPIKGIYRKAAVFRMCADCETRTNSWVEYQDKSAKCLKCAGMEEAA